MLDDAKMTTALLGRLRDILETSKTCSQLKGHVVWARRGQDTFERGGDRFA